MSVSAASASMRPTEMTPRTNTVLAFLQELQEATETSGLDAMTRVAGEVDQVLAPFQRPQTPCHDSSTWAGVDNTARGLYPSDAPGGLFPLKCKGEGNLLFDAVSMLLAGNTELSLELQVRTVVEMVLWKRYYLSGMIDSKMMLQAVRFSLCAEESEDMLNLPVTVLEAIFDADVKASCFPGSYANMWHLYALSSVLQFNIYSIYPMFNLKIRPYFNRVIRPRKCPEDTEPPTIHVMWSGELLAQSFRPTYFVALVQMDGHMIESPDSDQSGTQQQNQHQGANFSYPNLKDRYKITERTFYRWKRQTEEHCKRSAARHEAKYFLQACYLEGKLIPLHQFKEFFPEISRSSYYNWKHELLKSGGNLSASSSAGEISPGESTEQEAWSSPEAKQDESDHHDSVASMFGLNLGKMDVERAQNVAHMQEAKRCLQQCIAMNSSLPFRIFKRNFPGISRSTYYNWRREAMLVSRGYKANLVSSEDSSDADKSESPKSQALLSNINLPITTRPRISRPKHRSFRMAYISKKQLREAAKLHVQKSRWSLTKFKLKFPSMSSCLYWLWRNSKTHKMKKKKIINNQNEERKIPQCPGSSSADNQTSAESQNKVPLLNLPKHPESSPIPTFISPHIKHTPYRNAPVDKQMFALDVVALANFKAKAKLFLQQRFEEKSFPTYKEFRSYFPLTARSTYYMWKRALHHGVSLVHG